MHLDPNDPNALLQNEREKSKVESDSYFERIGKSQDDDRQRKEVYLQELVSTGALRQSTKAEYEEWLEGYWSPTRSRMLYFDAKWNGEFINTPIFIATRNIDLKMQLSEMGVVQILVPEGITVTGPQQRVGLGRVVLLDLAQHTARDTDRTYSGDTQIAVWSDTFLPKRTVQGPNSNGLIL